MKREKDFWIFEDVFSDYNIAISLRDKNFINENDMSFNFQENQENRERFFSNLKIENLFKVRNKQIHSKLIHKAEKDITKEGDGLFSDDKNYALYLLTADCYNIFFTTDNGNIFGCIHAGWKGIIEGIVEESLKFFKKDTRTLVLQGICDKHFIVEEDVKKLFEKRFGESYIKPVDKKFSIDLRKIVVDLLKQRSDVENIELCNVCRKDVLFSYREGDIDKRNISIIWRKM
ncbi:MAG: polyphenol oxidase family protein [candidate division WOR-3 bacterium]